MKRASYKWHCANCGSTNIWVRQHCNPNSGEVSRCNDYRCDACGYGDGLIPLSSDEFAEDHPEAFEAMAVFHGWRVIAPAGVRLLAAIEEGRI